MKKQIALVLALALPFAASSAELSYTYVEGGYNKVHVDDEDLIDQEADGVFVRGSVALGGSVYLLGGASRASQDFRIAPEVRVDIDVNTTELGLGYHQSMSERVDFLAELAYLRQDVDVGVGTFGRDELSVTGGRASLGVRGMMGDSVEGVLKVGYLDGGDYEGEFTGTAGLQYRFTPTWGVTGEIEFIDNTSRYLVGVRASF
ncbi:outer membrane beta-barrel protein [Cognatilysobacter bugurensis]|uniref:Outer membrane protein beta-barrel domain-containing protein n=1 Tax=Cognatilysobacter bugurensis TaxID=543356 RepID=A0A918WA01_9GAMM|nr:outer membrane beta-barrel protein [Lysobacter bugurensis]GHA81696.1 hypothetical protein GCM10007067_19460 [Lysobacter bugurensis]